MTKDESFRNSSMKLNEVYFWTDTVKDWKTLLIHDKYKQIIIDSWKWLVDKQLVNIYGFCIMPNHLHILWEMLELNGKEMPHASFNKYTSIHILKDVKCNHSDVLTHFKVDEKERKHRIWQRDPLAIVMDYQDKFEQKLTYLHNNPLHERWNLAEKPRLYQWSSAGFYETGIDGFGLLTHFSERFS